MEKKCLKAGNVVKCKASGKEGKKYLLTETDGVFTAVEILPEVKDETEAEERIPEVLPVSEENLILFRYHCSTVEEETPILEEYAVKDGILYRGKEQVFEQGEIKILELILSVKGKIIFLAEKNDMISIMSYRLEIDNVDNLLGISFSADEPTISVEPIEISDDMTGLNVSATKTETFENEEGEEEVRKLLISSSILVLSDKGKFLYTLGLKDIATNVKFFPMNAGEDSIFAYTTSESEKNGVLVETPKRIGFANPMKLLLAEELKGTEVTSLVTSNGFLTIETNEALYIIDPRYELDKKKLSGFYLVDLNSKEGETTYFFTNKDLEVKKVIIRETLDRGTVINY